VRCSVISERCASRGVKPSFEASPQRASGRLVVIGALPSSSEPIGVLRFS
jgi:hypothetical protein